MVYHDYIYIHIYIYLIVVYMKCVHTVICLLLTCLGYFTNWGLSALGRAGASVRRLDSTGPDLDGGIGRCAVYCLPGRTLWIIFFISFHIYFLICKDHRFKFSVQLSVVLTYSMIFKGGPQKKDRTASPFQCISNSFGGGRGCACQREMRARSAAWFQRAKQHWGGHWGCHFLWEIQPGSGKHIYNYNYNYIIYILVYIYISSSITGSFPLASLDYQRGSQG